MLWAIKITCLYTDTFSLKVVDPIADILKLHEIMQGWKIYYYVDVYEILYIAVGCYEIRDKNLN